MSFSGWWRTACAVYLLLAATTIPSPAQTFTTLLNFGPANGPPSEYSSLVQGTDGNLYGTTGVVVQNLLGNTVFKATLGGRLTTLYSFGAVVNPYGGLIQATDGNFYGTTSGTVFKLSSEGALTTLYTFGSAATDGLTPSAGLIQAADGSFFGTTRGGGSGLAGTVFKVTSEGTLTTLHAFNGTDGNSPFASLIQATDGNLYGTTNGGGSSDLGTVFRMTPTGALTTLHSFAGTDGSLPHSNLIQATDGNLYGTTSEGGDYASGTVFKITIGGTLTTLYSFGSSLGSTDGSGPYAGLVQATDGNFYGTTLVGGADGAGTVFKITSAGVFTTLHSFVNTDGAEPAGLVQATDGNLYGTARGGGAAGEGTIFKLTLPAAPLPGPSITPGGIVPVFSTATTIQPSSFVSIYGTNLAAALTQSNGNLQTLLGNTSVTIDGKPGYLYFVSPTQINLQAPDDAATGSVPVVVTTTSGSATSAVTLGRFGPSFSLLDSKHVAGIILRSNGSGAYGGGTYDIIGPTGNSLGYPTVAAKAGDAIELFGVGFGPTSPSFPAGQVLPAGLYGTATNAIQLVINGMTLTPAFAGITEAGLFQFNLTLPTGLGTGDVPLGATVGGVETQSGVVISLQ